MTENSDSKSSKVPEVVNFGYSKYECFVQKDEKKCRAECNSCSKVIVERCGTTSGFTR